MMRSIALGTLVFVVAALPGCSLPRVVSEPLDALSSWVLEAPARRPDGVDTLQVALGPLRRPTYAILLQAHGNRKLWRTEDGVALATDGPRVVGTSGLPEILVSARNEGVDPLNDLEGAMSGGLRARRLVDLATASRDPRDMHFGLRIDCRISATPGDDPEQQLLLVREACSGPSPIGSFRNYFLVRRHDGAVLRSQQWIGPNLPRLFIEQSNN